MSFQGYKITSKYVFCIFPVNYKTIVKMYFILGVKMNQLIDIMIKYAIMMNKIIKI